MPSSLHEALVEMFMHRPSLAADLLDDALDVTVPPYEDVRIEASEFADLTPTTYSADTVVVLTRAGEPVLAVVVEVQLGRDPEKRLSWPVYLTTFRARFNCPAVLLVVCVDAGIAAWCATPIEVGHPGFRLCPVVLGPDQVPVVTDVEQAGRAPQLAVLSAVVHRAHPHRYEVFDALLSALAAVDRDHFDLYSDLVLSRLPDAERRYLTEALMISTTYEFQSDYYRDHMAKDVAEGIARGISEAKAEAIAEGKAEGKAEGEARAVIAVLDARGVDVPADARTRITGCRDLDQLDTWVRRAVTADTVEDLFV